MKKYCNFKKSVIWNCRFSVISDISFIFIISNTCFCIFSSSSSKSNRHLCQSKTIFFFLRGDPYLMAKTKPSVQIQLRWWRGFAGSLQTKVCWSSKFYQPDELIKLKKKKKKLRTYDAKYIFFSLLFVVFSALSSLYWGIFRSREGKYGQ